MREKVTAPAHDPHRNVAALREFGSAAPITTHSPVYRRLLEFRPFVMETACIPGRPPFSWRALPDNVTPRIGDDAYPFSCLIFDPALLRSSSVQSPNPQIRVFLTFSGKCPGMEIPGHRVCLRVRQCPFRHSGSVALKPARNRRLFRQTPVGWYLTLTGEENRKRPAQSAQSGAGFLWAFSRAFSLTFACCST